MRKKVLTLVVGVAGIASRSVAFKLGDNELRARLPLFSFAKENKNAGEKRDQEKEPPVAFLDSLVLGEWEDHVQRDLFLYDIVACETKKCILTEATSMTLPPLVKDDTVIRDNIVANQMSIWDDIKKGELEILEFAQNHNKIEEVKFQRVLVLSTPLP